MSEFISKLTRKNSLRKNCQELTVDQIEKVLSDLGDILEDKKTEEAAEAALLQEKQEKIEQIRALMSEAGISAEELDGLIDKPKSTVKAKYRCTDDEGNVHEWSGRGRTPKAFQKKFDQGAKKEDFLIQD